MKSTAATISFNWARPVFLLLLAEWTVMMISGVGFQSLHGDPFFTMGVDPFYWIFFLLQIPQTIIANHWLGMLLDLVIFLLLFQLSRRPGNYRAARILFLLMLLYYITLTAYLTHSNYQLGIFLVIFPFIFKSCTTRNFGLEAARYFILLYYCSAALLKIVGGGLLDSSHFGGQLAGQFAPYFLEHNLGFRTSLNIYLVQHATIAWALYIAGFLMEAICLVGFFTKKYDRALAIMLVVFHLVNWLLMDIGAIGQLAFISLLYFSSKYMQSAEQSAPTSLSK